MRFRQRLAAASLGLLAGCATQPPPPAAQLGEWIRQGDLARAQVVFDALPEAQRKDAAYQAQERSLVAATLRLEVATIAETSIPAQQGRWPAALAGVDKALDRYPHSTTLQHWKHSLVERRSRRAHEIDAEILATRARALLDEEALRQRRARAEGQASPARKDELAALAVPLRICGTTMLGLSAWTLADRCITLVNQFDEHPANRELRQMLDERRPDGDRSRRREPARPPPVIDNRPMPERRDEAVSAAEQALAQGDLTHARTQALLAAELDPHHPRVMSVHANVTRRLQREIDASMKAGDAAYRAKKIAAAIAAWQCVLDLDPDHEEARGKIRRAERVLSNLEDLRRLEQDSVGPNRPDN